MPADLSIVSVEAADGPPTVEYWAEGDLSTACDETLAAAARAGIGLYQQAGRLVKVVCPEVGRKPNKCFKSETRAPYIVPHDEVSLADALTRGIGFSVRRRPGGDLFRGDCPIIIARTILARREWPEDDVPHLKSVVEHPVVLPDGRLLIEPGYYPEVSVLIASPEHEFISVDESSSPRDDGLHSLSVFRDLFVGFAFEDPIDLSVMLASMMTFYVRVVTPNAPVFAFISHTQGSGKTTAMKLGPAAATGRPPAVMTDPGDETAREKLVFALLLEGSEFILLDNVMSSLGGAFMAAIATSPTYTSRILGISRTATVSTGAVALVSGNNLQIETELTRRTLVSRIDPKCERPAEREFPFDPIERVLDNRGLYVCALLTIMCGYLRSGERVKLRPFGSYELWSRMVREPLVWLGLPDPVDSIRFLEDADPEREALQVMLDVVHLAFGNREFRVADLVDLAKRNAGQAEIGGDATIALQEQDRERLLEALSAACDRRGELSRPVLGRWFLRMAGRIEGGRCFKRVRQNKKTSSTWMVEA